MQYADQNHSKNSLRSVSKDSTKEHKEKQRLRMQYADLDGISKPPLILQKNLQKRTPAPVISSTNFNQNVMPRANSKNLHDSASERGSRIGPSTPFIYHSQDETPSLKGSKSQMIVPSTENVKLGDEDETRKLLSKHNESSKAAWESRSPPIDNFFQEPDYELSPQPSPSPAPRVPKVALSSSPFELSDRKQAVKGGFQEHQSMLSKSYVNLAGNARDCQGQASVSVSDGKPESVIANYSKQEEGSNCSRKENTSKNNSAPKKAKSRRRKRNHAHALIHRHNTRPRANKPSEPSPMPEENLYSQVRSHCPITSSSVTDRHSTRPRANKQPEPSPMPVEEIYSQIRLASPATANTHEVKRERRQSSPNSNPRSCTPGSTMTFSSVTSMATSPASNNTQVHEGFSSRTFEETSDPREQEGMVVKGVKDVEVADGLDVPTRHLDMTQEV